MEKKTVILVEDHDVIRKCLKEFVEQVDHCQIIAEATDGEQAIAVIQSTPADLIILDLSLPRLSGVSVIKEAKKITKAKILVVTLLTDKKIIQQALDAGADGIVLKDKGVNILAKAILETLDGEHPVYLED